MMAKKIKKNIIIIFILLFSIAILFGLHIKLAKFPFVTMRYIDSASQFNASPNKQMKMLKGEFSLKIPLSKNFKNIITKKFDFVADQGYPLSVSMDSKNVRNIKKLDKYKFIFKMCKSITEYVRSKMYHYGHIVTDIENILQSKEESPGLCGGYAKFVCGISQSLGYPSRIVWTRGHTLSEIYFKNYGWVCVDSHRNMMYKSSNDKFSGILNIILNYHTISPVKITTDVDNNDPSYKRSVFTKTMKDNKIIVVLEGEKVLSYSKIMKNPFEIINYAFGKDLVHGIQYVKNRNRFGNKRTELQLFLIVEIILLFILIKNIISLNASNK